MHKDLLIPECLALVNVGNTHIQIADSNGVRTFSTPESSPETLIRCGMKIAAASVVPEWSRKLSEYGAFMVDADNCGGLDLTAVDSTTVGADRLANAIAAAEYGTENTVVIDFGTAITFEAVDGKKRFLGGAIMPGRNLLRKALSQGTAQLPMLECSEEEHIPDIGHNTREAILLGVDRGVTGSVMAVLESILKSIGDNHTTVIGTGGDFQFFKNCIHGMVDGGEYFTLQGVLLAWKYGGGK